MAFSTSNTDLAAFMAMSPREVQPDDLKMAIEGPGRVIFVYSTLTPEAGRALYLEFVKSEISRFLDKRRAMGSLVASFKESSLP